MENGSKIKVKRTNNILVTRSQHNMTLGQLRANLGDIALGIADIIRNGTSQFPHCCAFASTVTFTLLIERCSFATTRMHGRFMSMSPDWDCPEQHNWIKATVLDESFPVIIDPTFYQFVDFSHITEYAGNREALRKLHVYDVADLIRNGSIITSSDPFYNRYIDGIEL